jgi:hypothetical protein
MYPQKYESPILLGSEYWKHNYLMKVRHSFPSAELTEHCAMKAYGEVDV